MFDMFGRYVMYLDNGRADDRESSNEDYYK